MGPWEPMGKRSPDPLHPLAGDGGCVFEDCLESLPKIEAPAAPLLVRHLESDTHALLVCAQGEAKGDPTAHTNLMEVGYLPSEVEPKDPFQDLGTSVDGAGFPGAFGL